MKKIVAVILIGIMLMSFVSCQSQTPYIGENGNWWVGEQDLGVAAQGPQGEQNSTDYEFIIGDKLTSSINMPVSFPLYDAEPIIIQGHMDMVCEKESGCDINFEKYNQVIQEQWLKNRSYIEEKLEKQIATVAQTCKKYGVPYGCTEGWGTVCWAEHPLLTWDLIKDAAVMAARLGHKYGYTFNCQSNFCEPQFVSLWRDIEHHREVTDIIKGVKR